RLDGLSGTLDQSRTLREQRDLVGGITVSVPRKGGMAAIVNGRTHPQQISPHTKTPWVEWRNYIAPWTMLTTKQAWHGI
ncbi:hypothetical protein CYMTET_28933, partial [Cymbomonas tetramitiformis]